MGVSNCSMFCCRLLYVHSCFAIIFKGKRELVAMHSLSSRCLVMVVWLFLAVPWVCLRFVIVVFLIILTIFAIYVTLKASFHNDSRKSVNHCMDLFHSQTARHMINAVINHQCIDYSLHEETG